MYYRCNLFPGYIRFFHLRARDVTSSVKGHHVLLATQRATFVSPTIKIFSKMQRLLVNFDLMFDLVLIKFGTNWNYMASILNSCTLPHILMEHSNTPVIHSVHLAEEFAGCLLKQIGTLNI
jgi:hypothetical protein